MTTSIDKLLIYNHQELSGVLDNDRIFIAAVMEDEPIRTGEPFYKLQAIAMNLDTLEIAALGPRTYGQHLDQSNSNYKGLFTELSTSARVLTCTGVEVLYIPRKKNQSIPPDEIRIFDPSQEETAHHISNIRDFEKFKTDLYQMSLDL